MEELHEIIDYIKNTEAYKNCISLREQMNNNTELVKLIEEIKLLQKEYIKSNFDKSIKEKLDEKNNLLDEYPIYNSYNKYLEEVNQMINYVNDEMNDYFNKVVNESN